MYSWVNILQKSDLSRKKKIFAKVVHFTGGHTLPNVITSPYTNFEYLVDSIRKISVTLHQFTEYRWGVKINVKILNWSIHLVFFLNFISQNIN